MLFPRRRREGLKVQVFTCSIVHRFQVTDFKKFTSLKVPLFQPWAVVRGLFFTAEGAEVLRRGNGGRFKSSSVHKFNCSFQPWTVDCRPLTSKKIPEQFSPFGDCIVETVNSRWSTDHSLRKYYCRYSF
jgi:hypothetical protein